MKPNSSGRAVRLRPLDVREREHHHISQRHSEFIKVHEFKLIELT